MSHRLISRLAALGIITLAAPAAFAQSTATASGITATAKISKPIAITSTAGLCFGELIPGASVGTAKVDETTGVVSVTGGVTVGGSTPTVSRAKFDITGKPNGTYTVKVNGGAIGSASCSLTGPGPAMTANTFAASTSTFQLDATGAQTWYLGATLAVDTSTNQTDGSYGGTFSVTVTYN